MFLHLRQKQSEKLDERVRFVIAMCPALPGGRSSLIYQLCNAMPLTSQQVNTSQLLSNLCWSWKVQLKLETAFK